MPLTESRVNVTQEPSAPSLVFRDVVEQHKRRVYYLARDLTGNHHDAEDLAQDVFVKVYRSLDSFRGDAGLSTWLYRITVNTYLNRKRKKALAFMRLRDDFADTTFEQDNAPATDERAESTVVQQHVDAALDVLSPSERTAFVLRHYHDLAIKEVAANMNVATGTVKSLLFRATQKLRKELAFYKDELGL